jgi:hydroxyacylglutathione hydrolase
MKIISLTYNPFSENTYLISGEKGSCIIIDAGVSNSLEEKHLFETIKSLGLSPVRHLLTHAHIDHVMGCKAVFEKYNLVPECHPDSVAVFEAGPTVSQMYGIPYMPGPDPLYTLTVESELTLDGEEMEIRYVPGHAPGHLVFIDHLGKAIVAGDTLFRESIGRTDLPGGNHELLLNKIREELFSLPDDYTVWPGHGPETSIGHEQSNNPFFN